MNLEDTFRLLENIASSNYIGKPMLVGGIPRDIYLGINKDFYKDIDLTTNSPDILRLGISFADRIDSSFHLFDDGHLSVYFQDYNYDFSSNFISENVVEFLKKEKGITDPKFFEIYSRDFTINTLHKELFSEDILDPTGMGLDDCNRKIIRTICDPNITLNDDPRRAYRAINFASRFGFQIDREIISFINKNIEIFSIEKNPTIKEAFVSSAISQALEADSDRTISNLLETNLFYEVPMIGRFKEELIRKRLVLKYLDNKKY
jgi:hypothetical protein